MQPSRNQELDMEFIAEGEGTRLATQVEVLAIRANQIFEIFMKMGP